VVKVFKKTKGGGGRVSYGKAMSFPQPGPVNWPLRNGPTPKGTSHHLWVFWNRVVQRGSNDDKRYKQNIAKNIGERYSLCLCSVLHDCAAMICPKRERNNGNRISESTFQKRPIAHQSIYSLCMCACLLYPCCRSPTTVNIR